jgi:hypothetical protein
MASIYVLLPDRTQAVFEDFEIPDLLREGRFTLESYVWKEGMPEWRPLSEMMPALVPAPPPAVPATVSPAPVDARKIEDLTLLTLFFEISLIVLALVNIVHFLGDFAQYELLTGPPYTRAAAIENDTRLRILGAANVLFLLISAIFYCLWIYRATKNCHVVSAGGMKFSPAFAVAANFIPIICLFAPYQVMRDVWAVSNDPAQGTQRRGPVFLLITWWMLWIIGLILGDALLLLARSVHDRPSALLVTYIGFMIRVINLPLALLKPFPEIRV